MFRDFVEALLLLFIVLQHLYFVELIQTRVAHF